MSTTSNKVFAVPVFFIVFRESLETAIVVAILLAFIKQIVPADDHVLRKRLVRQVWLGTLAGLLICLVVGGGLLGAFYNLQKTDLWTKSELLYEGVFCVIAALVLAVMGAAMLRISKLKEKWQQKILAASKTSAAEGGSRVGIWGRQYGMFLLPFVTVMREGLEAVVFVGGVGVAAPASSFPLPVIIGLLCGGIIGYVVYVGGNTVRLQYFLIASTCILYLFAAGLISRGAWLFDMYEFQKLVGGDVAETGVGPGSYNIHHSVWHVNCCSPSFDGGHGWGVFNSLLGWQNSATYSSVLTYNLFWIFAIATFVFMGFSEKRNRTTPKSVDAEPGVLAGEKSTASHSEAAIGEKVSVN